MAEERDDYQTQLVVITTRSNARSGGPTGKAPPLLLVATGRLSFGAGASNQHAVMFRIVQSPPDLDAVKDACLRELIERCLTKSAAERHGVDELLEGLPPDLSSDALRGAWLPPVLPARLAQQSALLLDADVPKALDVPERVEFVEPEGGAEPASPVIPEPSAPQPRDPFRRDVPRHRPLVLHRRRVRHPARRRARPRQRLSLQPRLSGPVGPAPRSPRSVSPAPRPGTRSRTPRGTAP